MIIMRFKKSVNSLIFVCFGFFWLFLFFTPKEIKAAGQVYWGATIKASDIGVSGGDPPWNMAGIDKFESDTAFK